MDSQWGLDDLLADLKHARQRGDLGRLAFVSYCDVRRWARDAGRLALADQATRLITESPHPSRDDFLNQVDTLISALEDLLEPGPNKEGDLDQASRRWSVASAAA